MNVTGTEANDYLMGTDEGDTLDGLGGADYMEGGPGDDAYVVDHAGDQVYENPDEGVDTIYSSVSYELPADVERLVLTGDADINAYGNDYGNEIYGNAGANTLLGLDSDDFLDGGAGNDNLDADGGNDSLYGGDGNDNLTAGSGDDYLDGGAGDDSLMGGAGDDVYRFDAGYGMDTASDSGGNDVLVLGGLAPADLTFLRSNNDLTVQVNATGERLLLQNWFDAGAIETFAFGDGSELDAAAVTAIAANVAPVAADDAVGLGENDANVAGNVLANDGDANGDALVVADPGTRAGTHGTLELAADGSYRYTPGAGVQALAAGESVTDLFGYAAVEGAGPVPLQDGAELRVTINGANDAPTVANAMADRAAQAGQAFSFALPAGAFADVDNGDRLSYSAALADGSALPGWLAFDANSGTFSGTAPGAASLAIAVTATDLAGAQAMDVFGLDVAAAPPGEEPPAEQPLGRHLVGTRRRNHLDGSCGDDLIEGRDGNDRLHGRRGVDILQGGKGNDELTDRRGGTLFDGGRGNDRMTGGRDDDFFAGGRGNDRLRLGGGNDVVAFNRGDGVDRLFGPRQDGVLSLGGGIRYEDLKFSKQGADLVLKVGGGDRIVLEDWYCGWQSIVTLQVVAEAMHGFSQGSCDPLRDDKVETFDFRKLVAAYDDARECRRNQQNWKLMNELLDAHLGGSDTAAYGGDVAYRYGMTGALAGMGWAAARDTVAADGFGTEMQTLRPAAEVNAGPVKLG